jgi:hypothetical protein
MYRVVAGISFSAQAKKGNNIMKFFDLSLGGLGAKVVQHTIAGGAKECNYLAFGGGTTIEQCSASSNLPHPTSFMHRVDKDGTITRDGMTYNEWTSKMGCWKD